MSRDRDAHIEELEQRLAEYRVIFDSTPVMFWYKDTENRLLQINRAAAEFEGVEQSEVVGKSCWDLYPKDQADAFFADDLEVIRSGRPKLDFIEAHTTVGTGKLMWVSVGKVPTRDASGRINGVIAFAIDITKRRQAEEQLRQAQKLESVGRLAGGIAHDFNNLLGGIIGYAELINTLPQSDPAVRGYADRILEAGQRASELTSQLLAFSRKSEATTLAVDLHEIARSVVGIVGRTVDPRIEIALELRSTMPVIQGDAPQLQSALLNLAVNACDAMPNGGKLVIGTRDRRLREETTFSHSRLATGQYVELAVADTGNGIPPEVLTHLFEPFFTTKDVGKGTGLGLATVYGTARAHDGGIDVSSGADGTEIRLFLPATGETEVDLPSADDGATPGAGRILLVDDDEFIRDSGRSILRQLGYKVLLAADGKEAVEIYSRLGSSIDLVILHRHAEPQRR